MPEPRSVRDMGVSPDGDDSPMVTIFAPSPTLTVTVEDHPSGSDVHVHAGGQGVWQARMLRRMGCRVTMCCVLTGEIGGVLRHLLEDEGFEVSSVGRQGRGSAYVHDRREGKRRALVEQEGDPLGRHELDDVYGAVLKAAFESAAVILSGPAGSDAVPAEIYRRLAADLGEVEVPVVADLAGERMTAVLEGGVEVLKVSHEELLDDGLCTDDTVLSLRSAMEELRSRGAKAVIVTRADQPLLLMDDEGFTEVTLPRFEENEARGAGDSFTAGVVAALSGGETLRQAVSLGAAAGALNVTRHGLGTGDGEIIRRLREKVRIQDPSADETHPAAPESERLSPDELAALAGDGKEA